MLSQVHVTDGDVTDRVGGGRFGLLVPSLKAPQDDLLPGRDKTEKHTHKTKRKQDESKSKAKREDIR